MSINSASNQHTPDDREQKCWDLYLKSVMAGKPNAKKAALTVGYSEPHADNITLQGWFKGRLEDLQDQQMLSKAEKKFQETLDYDPINKLGDVDSSLLRVQADVSKFLASTLGKKKYSTRTELTGAEGENLFPNTETKNKSKSILNDFFTRRNTGKR